MKEQRRAYPTACTVSRRPPYRTEEPRFYRCSTCGMVQVRYQAAGAQSAGEEEPGRCCGKALTREIPRRDERCLAEHEMRFSIFGGSEHNAVRVEVAAGLHPMTEEHHIEWIFLHTFQGGQMKYIPRYGRSVATFCMADEDAFVFCDREVCRMGWEHCLFQCKRGHRAYAYCSQHGLFQLTF